MPSLRPQLLEALGTDAMPRTAEARRHLLVKAAQEGVDVLLASEILAAHPLASDDERWWRRRLTEAVAADAARHAELTRVVAAWAADSVDALLLKGSGLAYTLYPAPWLRPHSDVDVWCHPATVPRMRRSLERLGYAEVQQWNNEGKHQCHYLLTDAYGVARLIEVHLRIANPEVFAGALRFAPARATAVTVRGLPGGRTLSPLDALLLACVHRAAHHYGSRRLIWLYDIHLLARGLPAAQWSTFLGQARAGRIAAVCRDGLAAAASVFGTEVPVDVDAALAAEGLAEPSRCFLDAPREIEVRLSTVRALPTWRARAMHVLGWLFPSPGYMAARYGVRARWLLPFWYGYRVVTRLPSWWRRYEV